VLFPLTHREGVCFRSRRKWIWPERAYLLSPAPQGWGVVEKTICGLKGRAPSNSWSAALQAAMVMVWLDSPAVGRGLRKAGLPGRKNRKSHRCNPWTENPKPADATA